MANHQTIFSLVVKRSSIFMEDEKIYGANDHITKNRVPLLHSVSNNFNS